MCSALDCTAFRDAINGIFEVTDFDPQYAAQRLGSKEPIRDANIERWRKLKLSPKNKLYCREYPHLERMDYFIVVTGTCYGGASIYLSEGTSPTFAHEWMYSHWLRAIAFLHIWLEGNDPEPSGWVRTTAGVPAGQYRRRNEYGPEWIDKGELKL